MSKENRPASLRDPCMLAEAFALSKVEILGGTKVLRKKLVSVRPKRNLVWSTKFEGQRAFWMGGADRGMLLKNVSWSNDSHMHRYKNYDELRSTGLWSRYYNPIFAPAWWVDEHLAHCDHMLDMEIYGGIGMFQKTTGLCRKLPENMTASDEELWRAHSPQVFDMPCPQVMLRAGGIRINGNEWFNMRELDLPVLGSTYGDNFKERLDKIALHYGPHMVQQLPVLGNSPEEKEAYLTRLATVEVASGGEGVMVRSLDDEYTCSRSPTIQKVKPRKEGESEALVIGTTDGKEGGRTEGMIGAFKVRWWSEKNVRHEEFCINCSDNESRMKGADYWIGRWVKFDFRALSDDGIPIEASFKGEYLGEKTDA